MATINVKAPKVNREWIGEYDFGADLDSATEKFGKDAVYKGFVAESVIAVQGVIRDMLTKGKTNEEIEAAVAAWKPGATRVRAADPISSITQKFAKMSKEEKIAFLQKLKNMIAE